eukprot:SM000108S14208  [mRNA]  locus=s108:251240:255378:+ [translate_table: standard]
MADGGAPVPALRQEHAVAAAPAAEDEGEDDIELVDFEASDDEGAGGAGAPRDAEDEQRAAGLRGGDEGTGAPLAVANAGAAVGATPPESPRHKTGRQQRLTEELFDLNEEPSPECGGAWGLSSMQEKRAAAFPAIDHDERHHPEAGRLRHDDRHRQEGGGDAQRPDVDSGWRSGPPEPAGWRTGDSPPAQAEREGPGAIMVISHSSMINWIISSHPPETHCLSPVATMTGPISGLLALSERRRGAASLRYFDTLQADFTPFPAVKRAGPVATGVLSDVAQEFRILSNANSGKGVLKDTGYRQSPLRLKKYDERMNGQGQSGAYTHLTVLGRQSNLATMERQQQQKAHPEGDQAQPKQKHEQEHIAKQHGRQPSSEVFNNEHKRMQRLERFGTEGQSKDVHVRPSTSNQPPERPRGLQSSGDKQGFGDKERYRDMVRVAEKERVVREKVSIDDRERRGDVERFGSKERPGGKERYRRGDERLEEMGLHRDIARSGDKDRDGVKGRFSDKEKVGDKRRLEERGTSDKDRDGVNGRFADKQKLEGRERAGGKERIEYKEKGRPPAEYDGRRASPLERESQFPPRHAKPPMFTNVPPPLAALPMPRGPSTALPLPRGREGHLPFGSPPSFSLAHSRPPPRPLFTQLPPPPPPNMHEFLEHEHMLQARHMSHEDHLHLQRRPRLLPQIPPLSDSRLPHSIPLPAPTPPHPFQQHRQEDFIERDLRHVPDIPWVDERVFGSAARLPDPPTLPPPKRILPFPSPRATALRGSPGAPLPRARHDDIPWSSRGSTSDSRGQHDHSGEKVRSRSAFSSPPRVPIFEHRGQPNGQGHEVGPAMLQGPGRPRMLTSPRVRTPPRRLSRFSDGPASDGWESPRTPVSWSPDKRRAELSGAAGVPRDIPLARGYQGRESGRRSEQSSPIRVLPRQRHQAAERRHCSPIPQQSPRARYDTERSPGWSRGREIPIEPLPAKKVKCSGFDIPPPDGRQQGAVQLRGSRPLNEHGSRDFSPPGFGRPRKTGFDVR